MRLRAYGVQWGGDLPTLLETYFGEGTGAMWRSGRQGSSIAIDGQQLPDPASRLNRGGPRRKEAGVFYVPAQRTITMHNGWPRPFSDYAPSDPFTLRDFSDNLRVLVERTQGSDLFPQPNRLKGALRSVVDDAVFRGFGLKVDRSSPQKRLVLGKPDVESVLTFMTWSSGQREFVPLLLGMYWLLPPARLTKRPHVDWVVIEEPEMGLHPRAIGAVMLLALELLSRGYRVCMSTHSPHVLDILWGLGAIQRDRGTPNDVADLFGVAHDPSVVKIAEAALLKTRRVFFFDPDGEACDISDLDPGSELPAERGWGELTGFSDRVGRVVARLSG
jgi:hypothetical protein